MGVSAFSPYLRDEERLQQRMEAHQREWERLWLTVAPRIFTEYERWRRPWWARAVAWTIATFYLIREVGR